MSDYQYWDDDVERVVNHAMYGNKDIYEIMFKEPVEAFNLHKDDVVHLAKCFGLVVFDGEDAL